MDLQELITRGRHIFAGAPARLKVFVEVNGKRTAKEIAERLNRQITNVHRDIAALRDAELIQDRLDNKGEPIKCGKFPVYEKIPLARTVPTKYFGSSTKRPDGTKSNSVLVTKHAHGRGPSRPQPLKVPTEQEILDICEHGEDQTYEFKSQGTDMRKISKEIAAMLHSRRGGIILYGVQDDGTIEGSDKSRQTFDQSLQNSLHNTVSPSARVKLCQKTILGSSILIIVVPPWNRKDVYMYEGRTYTRKGSSVLVADSNDVRRLHNSQYLD